MNRLERLVWIDLETTGLNPRSDMILEIAAVVTDGDLVELAAVEAVIGFYLTPEARAAFVRPVALQMHKDNGLWEACRDGIQPRDAASLVCDMVNQFAPGYRGPICGSSPQFDKGFLDSEMPRVAALFNHRVYDVSTLRQEAAQQGFTLSEPPGGTAHRAMADIRASIEVARNFRLEMP